MRKFGKQKLVTKRKEAKRRLLESEAEQDKPLCSSLRRRVNLASRLMIKKPVIDPSEVNTSQ